MAGDILAQDVQAMLKLSAEPVRPGELIAAQIRRAARRCSLTFGRARKLWYGEARVSVVDLVAITQALNRASDSLVAYQDAKALLLREQAEQARRWP